ncbi:ImmA/IrrE family metallo-endopeptidase [Burkholderia gladioli]|uniref:ImmA/IrrE family metallo-endopeptidase n=1 Tax=Burkholderia gladioli TaxID=28095 RepID=UPI0034DB65D7
MGYGYIPQNVQADVESLVAQALRDIACLEPPVSFADLFEHEKLKASTFSASSPDYVALVQQIGADADSVRGCLFVPDRLVFARDDGYAKRMNFVLAHELGHWLLPWHRDLLYACSEFDLSQAARSQLEREANFFASEVSFMGKVFSDRLAAGALSFKNLSKLADAFDMSLESTVRRAVELETRPCVFMSMKTNDASEEHFLTIRYIVYSVPYSAKYDAINHTQTFPRNHVLAKVITDQYASGSNHFSGEVVRREDKTTLLVEGWKNKWNVFALLTPKEAV